MSDIECPFCAHEYVDDAGEIAQAAADTNNNTTTETCPKCGEEFAVYVEWEAQYYPRKLP